LTLYVLGLGSGPASTKKTAKSDSKIAHVNKPLALLMEKRIIFYKPSLLIDAKQVVFAQYVSLIRGLYYKNLMFRAIGFFNEADTLESTSILIYYFKRRSI
jgi:hypothetical protein